MNNLKKSVKFFALYFLAILTSLTFLNSESLEANFNQNQVLPEYVEIYGPFGFYMNVDSHLLLDSARNPSMLLEKNSVRQQRPFLILASSIIGKIIEPVNTIGSKFFGERSLNKSGNYNTGYAVLASYIILNFLIMWLCFLMNIANIKQLFLNANLNYSQSLIKPLVAFTSSIIFFNGITKTYLITPHFQLLNILAPIAMIYFATMNVETLMNTRKQAVFYFLLGLGLITYQVFILPIACLFLRSCAIIRINNITHQTSMNRVKLSKLILLSSLSLLPLFVWNSYLLSQGVDLFLAEIGYSESNGFLDILTRFVTLLILSVLGSFVLPFLCILLLIIFLLMRLYSGNSLFISKALPPNLIIALLCFFAIPFFYSISGITSYRIADAAVYPLLIFLLIVVINLNNDYRNAEVISKSLYLFGFINFLWLFAYFNFEVFIPYSAWYIFT